MKCSKATKKILANAGYTFFLSMSGLVTMGALTELNVPFWFYIGTSVFISGIQFGLVACREYGKREEEMYDKTHKPSPKPKTESILDCGTANGCLPGWRGTALRVLEVISIW